MIKRSAAALLLSSTLMTGVALAQTDTTPAPATSSPAPSATMGAGAAGSAQFLTQQDQGQFRASKFVGLAIYGQDNQRIGDVNEILIDGSGNAKAVVIGVGGFLGIGEKNVAVPFAAVEWVNERPASTAAASGTAGTAGGTLGTGTGTTASRDASVTGSTAAAPARSGAETAAANGYPDHGKVRMSKADLQNAPAFKWYGETQSNRGTGTAPRQ
ncbi:PRC-barrel domain-containing protein [Enterovirga aerilata]|uniref:PRC-barrel domain-containing protein n=1 Tax=Enterovirga aerilata TaxID=2730920 RepID=A0A849HXJ6_9HYPH|nr:PRC-barrel domain-containing protein [Enterovirga sp. DB1703]NNM72256.1 PRC-barrel domain-containing protein [Enterovirga sp. DB1703]